MGVAICSGLHRAAICTRDGALRRGAAAWPERGGAGLHSVCGRAWIALEDQPVDVETEAYVAIAGPVVGTIAALAVYLWARSENSGLLLAISYSGLFLNLFNLLPISPLDGGRVTAVLSPRIWFLGVPILLALMLYRPSPMLVFVVILAVPQLLKAWRYDAKAPENIAYYGVPLQTRLEYGAAYLALAGLLAVMTYDVHEMLGLLVHPV
jgi:Zn-dependent protease